MTLTSMRYTFLVLFTLGFYSLALAQYSETISSDRPGMSFSPSTLGSRVLQYQIGGDFIGALAHQPTGNNFDAYLGGTFDGMLRLGILERFEVGFPVNYSTASQIRSATNTPASKDLRWGLNLRANVLKSNGATPNIGLLVEVRLPDVETKRFANEIGQLFLLLFEQPFGKIVRLSSNTGVLNASLPQLVYTLNLSVDVAPIATIFVEHAGSYLLRYDQPTIYNANQDPEIYHLWYCWANGGVSVRPLADFQIDFQGGYGTYAVGTDDIENWYAGMGISWRIRFKKRDKQD